VHQLAMEILSRFERTVQEDPKSLLNSQCALLPREIEDSKAYFVQKITHAREVLTELASFVGIRSEGIDQRDLIKTELMLLFVLVESYRPERISEFEGKLGEDVQSQIRQLVESLHLDVINIRERLK